MLRISLHENKYDKYKDVHFMLDFIRFYILMNMSAECAFWFLNLKIQGAFKSSCSSLYLTEQQTEDLVSSSVLCKD